MRQGSSSESATERFVADGMLGKIALWLRLTGHDCYYAPDMSDDDLLTLAAEENRVLLTSDEELDTRAISQGLKSMLVRGDVDAEVASVFREFHIRPEVNPSVARCSKCNGRLTEVQRDEKSRLKGLVYESTLEHYDKFWLCESCNSVYFQGGHWKNITAYMERIQEMMGDTRSSPDA
ncbi:MAG: Mut7-C RNAse domain-containing protein [Candidatus Thorarchaeota archaeon]|nr:Mut7-C RNAse domain-containing protein [Candidatus Thorarchaeota archaeon]